MANMYGYNSSSAHKLGSYTSSGSLARGRKAELDRIAEEERKRQKREAAAREQQRRRRNTLNILKVAAVFAVAFLIIHRYVQINEASSYVTELQDQYHSVLAENEDIQAKIDKAIDLEELQRVAGEEFGMVRPERYQMFYIDMNMGDYSENIADESKDGEKKAVAAHGAVGTIIGEMKKFE